MTARLIEVKDDEGMLRAKYRLRLWLKNRHGQSEAVDTHVLLHCHSSGVTNAQIELRVDAQSPAEALLALARRLGDLAEVLKEPGQHSLPL